MTDDINKAAIEAASVLQRRATDPKSSIFVSANAGTGKTEVLVRRVLRLLLQDEPADSILCVTYTKAAATEMRQRLYRRLSAWAVCDKSKLLEDIQGLLGKITPTQKQIENARSLFARILDNENGPQIKTVHSFCQSILKRFPVESGVTPRFGLILDFERDQLIQDCFFELMEKNVPPISQSLDLLNQQTDESQIFEHIKTWLQPENQYALHQMADDPAMYQHYADNLARDLDHNIEDDNTSLLDEIISALDEKSLTPIADMLASGGVNQQKRGDKITTWLALNLEDRRIDIDQLIDVFLKKGDRQRYSKYSDKEIDKSFPNAVSLQEPVIEACETFIKKRSALRCFDISKALCQLAIEFYKIFQEKKATKSVLDYDDLILKTKRFLEKDNLSIEWVMFKLDQSIDHLLVDEAQDTNPEQWHVLKSLYDSFFDNVEATPHRTVFVVGDYKQSIYSFQGARPEIFFKQQEELKQKSQEVNKAFDSIDFTLSFRSSSAILTFVDQVMQSENITGIGENYLPHDVCKNKAGLVEIWPITKEDSPPKPPYFDVPPSKDADADDNAANEHANKVAKHIKSLLEGSERAHFGCEIKPEDIMVLFRKRDSFFMLFLSALAREDVPVAGADRVILNRRIEIQDLLALADVCLLPEDDLQLACLLKSPLIGLGENQLLELAAHRGDKSLYQILKTHNGAVTDFGHAATKIRLWREQSRELPVFEFFNSILVKGGRADFHSRLGAEVDDNLNGFLLKAREDNTKGRAGLFHFVQAFRHDKNEIKREQDTTDNARGVKVMSIHGAKGLEAKIVYLPDMLKPRLAPDTLVGDENGLYWPSSSDPPPPKIAELKEKAKTKKREENDRLLYVALTRAEQALFISGWGRSRIRMIEESWFEGLETALKLCDGVVQDDESKLRLTSGTPETESPPTSHVDKKEIAVPTPTWWTSPPPAQALPVRPLTPSYLGVPDQVISFSQASREHALDRGSYVHKLFEHLPLIASDLRLAAALRIAENFPAIKSEAEELFHQAFSIIDAPQHASLFAPEALSEVSISGLIGTMTTEGQIDRLGFDGDKVILADFKTGMPPKSEADISQNYKRQMAIYGALVQQIYPNKQIICQLIWTQSCAVSLISEAVRQEEINRIIGPSSP